MKSEKEYLKILKKASDAYYNDEAIMSDEEFDIIYDEFKKAYPDHKYFKTIGAKTNSNLPKVSHSIPMGSQSKILTEEELNDFVEKTKKIVKVKDSWILSEKLDGISLSLIYENGKITGITRGDGEVGEDISFNVIKINDINKIKNFTGIVRGELLLKKSVYEKYFNDKANPRNAVSGLMRRLDGEGVERVNFYAYDLIGDFETEKEKLETLRKVGFKTPHYEVVEENEIHSFKEKYEEKRDELDYEIDGLILSINNIKEQKLLGIVDKRPKYSRAYKFSSQKKAAKMTGVRWQTGKTGRITPVAEVEPVKLAGVMISNLSLHNLSELTRLGIGEKSKVLIERAGDVIPQVVKVLEKGKEKINIPKKCPSCEGKTTEEEVFLLCKNESCPAQNLGTLLTFVETMGIMAMGSVIVEKLIEKDLLKEPADLFKLKLKDLVEVDRMGEKLAKKLLDQIKAKKTITLPELIKSLSINNFSSSTMELLLPYYKSIDEILKAPEEDLVKIQGIGEKTAKVIKEGLKEKKPLIDNLLKFLTIEEVKATGTKFSGISVCFTGVRDSNLEKEIVKEGGKISSGVSKNLSYLVCADKENSSSKLKKAKDLNIEIYSLEEFKLKFK